MLKLSFSNPTDLPVKTYTPEMVLIGDYTLTIEDSVCPQKH